MSNLPQRSGEYEGGLRALANARAMGVGKPILKMDKHGNWVYGAEGVAVSDGELWLVNPESIMAGVVGWDSGDKVGEEMYRLGEGTVDKSKLPRIDSTRDGDGWKDQLSVDLMRQADRTEVTFKTSSTGGKNAIGDLANAILAQNEPGKVPLVRCVTSSYNHKTYGKTYVPTFVIEDWIEPGAAAAPAGGLGAVAAAQQGSNLMG